MYVDFDRFEGHLGARIGPKSDSGAILGSKIGPKSDLGAILGAKIGPRWSQNRPRRGPKRNQEGQKRKAASPRRPGTPPDEIFPAMPGWPGGFGSPKSSKIGQEMVPKIDLIFDLLFNRFWVPKSTKKWSQNGPKINPKDIKSKSDFQIDFECIFG